ncbi:glycosyltransferase [Noviherbaspirillum sp.]|uniref:glycosyltransferase n=1 Tax=Noviherbaspirillum sp. TaxID=1926288 RepID=UPI002FE1C448
MVKRVLMIAFHYPPLRGSSGLQRTLKFSRYIKSHDWEPMVLTAHPRAYASTSNDQMAEIPDGVHVSRAFAMDTARHLSFKGRYLGLLALPDRWVSWWLGAVPSALKMVRARRPDVIWSTYPIATAHLIALSVHRLTGLPWIADMRDPMTDEGYPANPLTRRAYQWIEKKTLQHCTKAVCTTPGTIAMYQRRFPEIPASRFALIENGYDEENFQNAQAITNTSPDSKGPFSLVHSGVIYPSERDPTQFFQAIDILRREGKLSAETFRVVLRATGHDEYLGRLIAQYEIGDIVKLEPPVPYKEALAEMLMADGLLILQASNCNHQIPAKLYEYLRARRPILALTDPVGDTAHTLRTAGIRAIAPLDARDAIMQCLLDFIGSAKDNSASIPSLESAMAHSREARSRELAAILDAVIAGKS